MIFGLALPALGLVLSRARAAIGGPAAGAIAAAGVALVVAGVLALGVMWLRGDARRDAEAVCAGERLAAELAVAERRNAAMQGALAQAAQELRVRRQQQDQADAAARAQAAEAERLRNDVAKLEEAAGAARAVCLPDDRWLRRKRPDPTGAGPGGRPGSGPVPAAR